MTNVTVISQRWWHKTVKMHKLFGGNKAKASSATNLQIQKTKQIESLRKVRLVSLSAVLSFSVFQILASLRREISDQCYGHIVARYHPTPTPHHDYIFSRLYSHCVTGERRKKKRKEKNWTTMPGAPTQVESEEWLTHAGQNTGHTFSQGQ